MGRKSKIKMALIATYPEMSKIFLDIANKRGIIAYDHYASFDDALEAAKKYEPDVDIILSRGGTAAYLRENLTTPVVFIPITSFDVLEAARKLGPDVKEVALIHYDLNTIRVLDVIDEIFGIKIHDYKFITREDIERDVREVIDSGVRTIIGGEVAVRLARAAGIEGIELSAGVDTINRAIEEAIQIVENSRKTCHQAARLEAAFNAITDGVVITDENGDVVVSNPNAENILGKKGMVGEKFIDDAPDSRYSESAGNIKPQYDYLRKIGERMINASNIPVEWDSEFVGMVNTFEDVTKIQRLEQDIRIQLHKKGLFAKYRFGDIITDDPVMKSVIHIAKTYAGTDLAILIEGESGTGKELFAQSIHNASRRAEGPFVAINCAAIPEHLLESELFGYEAGAFTGASKSGKGGYFELAHGGTIFLDEIGEMPMQLQTRLLRVLQEKEVMRLGGSRYTPVDVRVVSASNQSLLDMTERNAFREDLYYRLNVLNVKLPPLRKRRDDIEPLLREYLERNEASIGEELLQRILPVMKVYDWPGNVRELQNAAQRLSFIASHRAGADMKELITILGLEPKQRQDGGMRVKVDITDGLKGAVAKIESEIIEQTIEECYGDHEEAARRLKIGRTTLWRKGGKEE
ncbi:MAG: sigma 54-interacting transcriptional regulator [Clostridiales Family XIII bacterium]|nr:sigma 54-interacting transcriptional regulator [Clostridiales Family XIII bacterium]